ncbi:MAG: glycine cleavage system aminomethyltransferase GcvT [Verrucomicrobia bacterium]|nr:glycine cleavage system aminomethyltransferase GcvT [Verrucomicrobiota bacterium]
MESPQTTAPLRRTPLHANHLALGARMAPFGGFDMPIQYTSILQEHLACREGTAIFDTCHMGEFFLQGQSVATDLDKLVSCEVPSMAVGQCRYGLLCNEDGGVRDDLILYRLSTDAFMIVVNAGTQDDDFAWISAHLSPDTFIANWSDDTAKIDIQGPGSVRLASKLLALPVTDLRYYRFMQNAYAGHELLISRTGYTGEVGFELYVDTSVAQRLWNACLTAGAIPAGLGARDTLRLEVGMPLYGHELDVNRNGAEAGFSTAIANTKNFVGAAALRDSSKHMQALVGIALTDRRAARAGDGILSPAGEKIGTVTSGSFAPSLGYAIALGYVDKAHANEANAVQLKTARDALPGQITKPPFYKQATARHRITNFL